MVKTVLTMQMIQALVWKLKDILFFVALMAKNSHYLKFVPTILQKGMNLKYKKLFFNFFQRKLELAIG